ncbi:hypothetical protein [Streptomyces cinereoruber]|uniref:hypothetical protein n=1 Tax=Streptomyces cinereoruber TaxID=67260 RepID=UPI00363EE311
MVANFNLTVTTADVSNPRIDVVVVYTDTSVTLADDTADGQGASKAILVAGPPNASPAAPNDAAIQSAMGGSYAYTIVAQVRVEAGVSAIAADKITDVRTMAAPALGLAYGGFSYIDSGCIWTATSGLAAGMTAGLVYVVKSGIRLPVVLSAIATHTFTANKDTYVSVNVSGVVTYSEVANNATPPSLPANSVWLAKVVSGASTLSSVLPLYGSTNPRAVVTQSGGITTVTGWDAITVSSSSPTQTKTVSYGMTFASIPNVMVSFGGDQVSGSVALGNGGNNVQGKAAGKSYSETTTGFEAYMWADTNWVSGNIVYFKWTAVGIAA